MCVIARVFFPFRNAERSQITRETFGAGKHSYKMFGPLQTAKHSYIVSDWVTHRCQLLLFWWRTWIKVFFLVFHDLISNIYQVKNESIRKGVREIDVSTFSENGSLTLPQLELAIRVRTFTMKCEAESFWSFSFKKFDLFIDWVSKKANVCTEQTSLRQDGGKKRWDQAWRRRELPGPFLPKSLQWAYWRELRVFA